MSAYAMVLSLHVVAAVLGGGQMAALALLAGRSAVPPQALLRLPRAALWSLVAMLATGMALVAFTGGAWAHTVWLRVSVALFVLAVVFCGLAGRTLRRMTAPEGAEAGLRRVRSIAWTVCGLVAAIAVLMETKPW